jgi:ferredoxin
LPRSISSSPRRRRTQRLGHASRKQLYNVGAILKGLVDHVQVYVRQAPDDRISDGEEAACAALSRVARVAPLRRRERTLHRLRALFERLSRQRDHGDRCRKFAREPNLAGERYAARYEIDELRCIFCGMCEEACPTDAIVLTPRFEMSDYRRGSLIYSKDRLLVPPDAGVGQAPDERPNGFPPISDTSPM